jgi:hypothetical protein
MVWRVIILIIFSIAPAAVLSQHVSLRGYVTDQKNSSLPYAHVLFSRDSAVAVCDEMGSFSRDIKPGRHVISVSFTGYKTFRKSFLIRRDTVLYIALDEKANQLDEVVVTSQKFQQEELFESTRTSSRLISHDDINAIPVLGGEADLIKALQLMPGVVRGIEGSSDLFVRGGAADQNLVLLDEVPVYNTSHLFGFLSVFNPDIVDRVESINGGFPADYGGRLSSVLDIQTISDHPDKTHLSGDVGTIATRLLLEQPLVKEKASFWIAGRRTYIDRVVKMVNEDLPYFFYDLNGKITFDPTPNDNISFTYFECEDFLDYFRDRNNDGDGITTSFLSENNSQSIRWQHKQANGWRRDLTLLRTFYRYNIRNSFEENNLQANSNIEDYGIKFLVQRDSLFKTNGHTTIGADWTQHRVSPNVVNTAGFVADFLESNSIGGRIANEMAVHIQHELPLTSRLRVNMGIRGSMVAVNNKTYSFPEPRFSARYELDRDNTLKLSYSRMIQYMHRVSSSAVSSPTDIWYPVTENVMPQSSHQVALAWQHLSPRERIFFSAEAYYKSMENLIGYEEGTNLFFNTDFESKLIQGIGRAYGFELMLKKESGKLTGWISYTLSWSKRSFDEIDNGNWFFSRYDRRHNGAIVAQYAFNKRWAASMVWEFISGSRFTPIIGQYAVVSPGFTGVNLTPIYSDINAVKLADTHRLDIGLKFKSRPGKTFQWQWFAGIYNVYNRANPISINIRQDQTDQSLSYEQPGLFGMIPFISYGFKL